MSGLNIQNSRLQQKYSTVTGATPTIAPSTDHTDGTWTENDIYVGELYINVQDDTVFYRSLNGIIPIQSGTTTINTTTFVNKTGDTMTGPLFAPTLSANTISATTIYSPSFQGTFIGDGSQLTGITSTTFTGGTISGPVIFTSDVNLCGAAVTVSELSGCGGTIDVYSVINALDAISATTFYGDGSNLTNLPYFSGITLDGVLAQGDTSVSGNINLSGGSITLGAGTFYGDGSGLTNIPFGPTPTLDEVLISGNTSTNGDILLTNGDIVLGNGIFYGDGSGLTNLPSSTDTYVSGGTYNNATGTATFTNTTGGTFDVTGFTTGGTSSQTLAETLVNGNSTGANDIQMESGRKITSSDPNTAYQVFTPELIRQYVIDTATTISTTVDTEQGSWNVWTTDTPNDMQCNIYSNVANPSNGMSILSGSSFNQLEQSLVHNKLYILSGDNATNIEQGVSQIQFTSSTQTSLSGPTGSTWFNNTFTPTSNSLTSNFKYPNPGFADYEYRSTVETYEQGAGSFGQNGYAQLKVEDLRGSNGAFIQSLNDGNFMQNKLYTEQDFDYTLIHQQPQDIKVSSSYAVFAGIEYSADYSANFTNLSLITKGYVDAAITAATSGSSGTLSSVLAAGNTTGANDIIFNQGQEIVHSGQTGTSINFTADTTYTGIKKIHIQGLSDGGSAIVGVDNDGMSSTVRMQSKNTFGGSANIFMIADDASIVSTTAGGDYTSGVAMSPNFIETTVGDSSTSDYSMIEQYPATHSTSVVNGSNNRSSSIALTIEAAGPSGTPSTGIKKREVNAGIYTDTYNRDFLQTGTTSAQTIFVSSAANGDGNTIMYTAKLFGVKTVDTAKQYVGDIKFAIGYRSGSIPYLIGSPIISNFSTLDALSVPTISVDSTSVYIKVRNNEGAQVEWSILVEECVHSKINI